MRSYELDGIHRANKEARIRSDVYQSLKELKDSILKLERMTGEDMTTECIMSLLEEQK